MTKVKRTYNLSPATVAAVRELAGRIASTQDAVIERSVEELRRRMRDLEHTRLWAEAAEDPEFVREMEEIFNEFEADDRAAWTLG